MPQIPCIEIIGHLARWRFLASADGVVGMADGGVVPAPLGSQNLGLDLRILAYNYRNEAKQPRFWAAVPELDAWRRFCSWMTFAAVARSRHAARASLPAGIEVLPFVLKGNVEFALFTDIDARSHSGWKRV